MAKKILDKPRVGAAVGQVIAAGVAQLVGMDVHVTKPGSLGVFLYQGPDSGPRKWCPLLGQKNIVVIRLDRRAEHQPPFERLELAARCKSGPLGAYV
jgi:hypothetical protein